MEAERPTPWKERSRLAALYNKETLSPADIANQFNCLENTIVNWLYRHGLKEPTETDPWQDPDRLTTLWHEKDLSTEEIAHNFGCARVTISRWLFRFNIPDTPDTATDDPWHHHAPLHRLYIEHDLDTGEVGEKLGCSQGIIVRWKNRYGIKKDTFNEPWQHPQKLRQLYKEDGLTTTEIADRYDSHSGDVSRWLARHGIETRSRGGGPYQDKDRLQRMYVEQEMSVTQIADELDCSHSIISYWLAKHGIKTRGHPDVSHHMLDAEEMGDPAHKNPELLERLYVSDGLDPIEIADELETTERSVVIHLKKYGLWGKQGQKVSLADLDHDVPESCPWRDAELMRILYKDHELSTTDIKELLDCSVGTVSNWLRKHDIRTQNGVDRPSQEELRQLYEDEGLSVLEIAAELGVSSSIVYVWVQEEEIVRREMEAYSHPELRDESQLRELYVHQEKSVTEIAREIGSNYQTVVSYLNKYGIEQRSFTEEISGENNPFWKGGQQPYGKGWTPAKKKAVLERDQYQCQSCGLTQEEHLEEIGVALHIHHIIPAREIDDHEVRNAMDNLVALCIPCHRKWEGIPLKPTLAD